MKTIENLKKLLLSNDTKNHDLANTILEQNKELKIDIAKNIFGSNGIFPIFDLEKDFVIKRKHRYNALNLSTGVSGDVNIFQLNSGSIDVYEIQTINLIQGVWEIDIDVSDVI